MTDIKLRITQVVSSETGADESDILPESKLTDDLNMNSLDLVELMIAVEEEFNVIGNDDYYLKWVTVQDIIDHFTPPEVIRICGNCYAGQGMHCMRTRWSFGPGIDPEMVIEFKKLSADKCTSWGMV